MARNGEVERNREIRRRYAAGETMAALAAAFGVSKQRVHQIIRDIDTVGLREARNAEIRRLLDGGEKTRAVAERVGLTPRSVRYIYLGQR